MEVNKACLLLFRIYINDIPQIISHSLTFTFADDTKLLRRVISSNDYNLLLLDIDGLQEWCSKWSLKLNTSKFVAMSFSNTGKEAGSYNSETKSTNRMHDDLGIIISSN